MRVVKIVAHSTGRETEDSTSFPQMEEKLDQSRQHLMNEVYGRINGMYKVTVRQNANPMKIIPDQDVEPMVMAPTGTCPAPAPKVQTKSHSKRKRK